MATAKVVGAWQTDGFAYLAVRVAEADGDVEYIGSVAVGDLDGLKAAEQRAALVSAAKAVRDRRVAGALAIPGFPTIVTV